MSIKFGHINIVINDLEAAREFFVNTFGFTAGPTITLTGPWVDRLNGMQNCSARYCHLALPGSETGIELLTYDNPPNQPEPGLGTPNRQGYRHIDFDVDNIDLLTKQIRSQGWTFLSDVQTVSAMNLKTVYFLGPEGVLIQMTQFGI